MPDTLKGATPQAGAQSSSSARFTHRPTLTLGEMIVRGFDGGRDTGWLAANPPGGPSRVDAIGREVSARYRAWAQPSLTPMPAAYAGQGPVGTSQWAKEVAADPRRGQGYQMFRQNNAVGGRNGTFVNGFAAPKCNIFVYDALRSSGIQPPLINGNVPDASQWADPSQISGYRVVGADEPLRPGDIISSGEHVGIYTPEIVDGVVKRNLTTSAATPGTPNNPILGGPVTNDWAFREPGGQRSPGMVVRRYAPTKAK